MEQTKFKTLFSLLKFMLVVPAILISDINLDRDLMPGKTKSKAVKFVSLFICLY